MKLTHLKALDKLAKSDKSYNWLQSIFIYADTLYAVTPYIILKVKCKEITDANFKWSQIDIDKAEQSNKANRYVKILDCLKDCENPHCDKWEYNYLDKFFDTTYQHGSKYDSKLLQNIIRVFVSFGIDIRFCYNEKNYLVTYEGFNQNYELQALLMPLK